ncbi:MAG: class I SAM-dependent methyltransferase [Candidatus Goldiibacteriota bacterium]
MSDNYLDLMFELYTDTPRQGPGTDRATLEAFKRTGAAGKGKILDIGSGTGRQIFVIAENSQMDITATDIFEGFLESIREQAKSKGLEDRVSALNADMNELPFEDGAFDMIWSEGAVYIIGFENGLKKWKRFLKPGGFMVVSDLCWTASEPPEEAVKYWEREYPGIMDMEKARETAEKNGYEVIDFFVLEKEGWTREYYPPLKKNLESFRRKYRGNSAAQAVVEESEKEMELYEKFGDYYGYVFFVLKTQPASPL